MSEVLKQIAELLLQNIYKNGGEKLMTHAEIMSLIMKLKTKTRLSLMFNIEHNLKNHKSLYPIANCENDHCFECLEDLINQGFEKCEHGQYLTAYEKCHIKWLSNRIKSLH